MLIDFHTHIFPDAIAAKAIKSLQKGLVGKQGSEFTAHNDATINGLLGSMKSNNVDISVVMPVVTRLGQTADINAFAEKINVDYNSQGVISFAGLFPWQEDWEAEMERIKAKGFLGIKLHPEFQELYMDDPRAVEILQKAEELDLCVMIHAGEDPGVFGPPYCSPLRLAKTLEKIKGDKIIAAHMGGWQCWDDVEKYLIGKNVWLDVSMAMDFLPKEQCERMIKAHGSEKILFGSDSPWQQPQEILKFLSSMELSETDMANITHKNAEKLLNL